MDDEFVEFVARRFDGAIAGPASRAGECPDENMWALLADDALSPSERRALIEHISRCATCRRLASEIISEWQVAQAETDGPEKPAVAIYRRIVLFPRAGIYAAAAVVLLAVGLYFASSLAGRNDATLLARAAQQIAAGQYEVAERELAGAMQRGDASVAVMQLRGRALMGAALAMATPGKAKLTSLGSVGILQRRTKELPTIPVPEEKLERALAMLQKAAEANPPSAAGWRELGAALLVARRFDEAVEAFGRWVQIEPSSAQAHNARGLALYGAECHVEAAAAFQRASAIASEVSAHELNAAIACEEAGKVHEAQRHWQRFLKLEPSGPDAEEVRRWLAVLQKGTP